MTTADSGFSDSLATGGGRIPGVRGKAAFVLQQPRLPATQAAAGARPVLAPVPIVIAVPHAGRVYPPDLLRTMRFPRESALRLEDRLVDLVGEAVAAATGATLLVAHAPRALIDLNRATDDIDWDMVSGAAPAPSSRFIPGRRSRTGLGLVPRRLPGVGELWTGRLPAGELAARIDQVHTPYHHALETALAQLRDRWGAALLIDLHSMPPLGPKIGPGRGADFVLGDRFGASCDSRLVQVALDHLARAGQHAAHNRPYAGGYVLDRHGVPQRGVNAVQLEICRSIYLDAAQREAGPGLARTVAIVSGLVRVLATELASSARGFAQAAE